MSSGGEQHGREPTDIHVPWDQMAGVWANWSRVHYSEHDFTLDFVRLDPEDPDSGILVARVALPPQVIMRFRDQLKTSWKAFAERSMPKEVQDGEAPEDPLHPGDGS